MGNLVGKTIKLELAGLNSNAFFLLGAFEKQARRERWTIEEIATVTTEAKKVDYGHLLATLLDHCDSPDEDDESGDE